MSDPEIPAEMLDLDQFDDLADALQQLSDSRSYEHVIQAALEARPDHEPTLLTLFALSSCTRFRSLHEAIVREAEASNPHAVFPLNRAFAETILTVAYAHDHPDYVMRLTERRGDQPRELRRMQVKQLIDHIVPDAPGLIAVYDELCEITHFGSLALWQPHEHHGDRQVTWRSIPQWRSDEEALIACAQLAEMSTAATAYLHNFVGRYIVSSAGP